MLHSNLLFLLWIDDERNGYEYIIILLREAIYFIYYININCVQEITNLTMNLIKMYINIRYV